MPNPSPETQNFCTYLPSSSDTDPQRGLGVGVGGGGGGGPWSDCVSRRLAVMVAQLSHDAV